jgi:hypothetical protein
LIVNEAHPVAAAHEQELVARRSAEKKRGRKKVRKAGFRVQNRTNRVQFFALFCTGAANLREKREVPQMDANRYRILLGAEAGTAD